MKKTIVPLLLSIFFVFSFSHVSAYALTKADIQQIAQQVTEYRSIGGKTYALEFSSMIMSHFVDEALTLNEDVAYHYMHKYPRLHAYVAHVEWDKLFFKDSYVVIESLQRCIIYHCRMDDVLRGQMERWQKLEDMTEEEYNNYRQEQRETRHKMMKEA